MSEHYDQSDPRLNSPHPSTYPWYGIPPPKIIKTAYPPIVKVSMITTSKIIGPEKILTAFAEPDKKDVLPSFSFLVEHKTSQGEDVFLWDLGMRPDPEGLPRPLMEKVFEDFSFEKGDGPIKKLKEGGYDVSRIDTVILSHQHFDHVGDFETLPKPYPDIVVGHNTLGDIGQGAPEDPDSPWPSKWIRDFHIVQLPPAKSGGKFKGDTALVGRKKGGAEADVVEREWTRLGCFEHAVNWFGDGSFWIIDAPGHCEGHQMALARVTNSPPTYILLAGDTCHHQNQYLPIPPPLSPSASEAQGRELDKRSPIPVVNGKPSLALDPPLLAKTIGAMTRMSAEEDVMVLMAHEPEAEGVLPEWPDDLAGWKQAGWKGAKERY